MIFDPQIVLTIIPDIAPEFAATDSDKLLRMIGYVSDEVSENLFKAKVNLACAYLVAHVLTMSARQGIAGSVQTERVGDLSVTYMKAINADHELANTSYGMELLRIRRQRVVTPMVVGMRPQT